MKLSRTFISATREMCELNSYVNAPYIRKTLEIGNVKNVKMSVCGLGFYRFWLNGTELTKGHMSPYISNPDQIMDYDVYDLSEIISEGKNVFAFQLGNGMQNAFGGYVWDFDKAEWRSAPKLAVCIELMTDNGQITRIESDESFLCKESPITYDDLRQGECYDARLEIPGWNLPEFDDSDWKPCFVVETPRGESVICVANPIVKSETVTGTVVGKRTLRYADSDVVDEGFLYVFPENRSGIPHLKIKGHPGQKVSMIFGEYTDDDDVIHVDNIRFVRKEYRDFPLYIQKDEYTCKGYETEEWEPVFTYHGFKYVLVTGISEDQAVPDLVTYVVMNTDLPEMGGFSCGDEILNKIQRMTRVSTLANFFHFPTDCPHREKNGWTADAALSVEQALLNLDPVPNYREWERHICASMNKRGALPGIVPTAGWGFDWGNGPAWDQVIVVIPYYVYRYRGDRQLVEDSLPYLLRYVNYLNSRTDDRGLIAIGLGDWCAYGSGVRSPQIFTDSVISMGICEKVAFLFAETGRHAQAEFCRTLADNYRKAIRKYLIDWNTMSAVSEGDNTKGCETSQAMAICYNVFTEEEKPTAFRVLLELIHANNDHLDTGVLGARVIFHVLSEFGYSELAYRMISDKKAPSYGYFADRGYTALPEALWPESFNVSSLNHHFWGDVSAWFIKELCGINLNPTCKDIHEAVISPHFVSAINHAEAYHICPDGKISVDWRITDNSEIILNVEVPDGLHGKIIFTDGYVCAKCGKKETELRSGTFCLKKE